MYGFDALDKLLKTMTALLVVFIPLGCWKLAEIIYWVWTHLELSRNGIFLVYKF